MVIPLKRHERLLLCSDGLWKLVPEAAIQHTVTRASTPQVACDALVNLANTNGGSDNVSVIIVKVDEEAG
jgi:protein phosphatase